MQTRAGQQFTAIKNPIRIDSLLIVNKALQVLRRHIADLGDPDTMLTGNHPAEFSGQGHDAVNDTLRLLHHPVIVGIDGDIGVYVAIAGVHVQGNEQATGTDVMMNFLEALMDRFELPSTENFLERLRHFLPVGDAFIAAQ